MEKPTPVRSNLTLSIDSWKFLNDDESPIFRTSNETIRFKPRPLPETPVDLLRFKRLLSDEVGKREQIMSRLASLEESASMFSDATEALAQAISELEETKRVLSKVGELALDHRVIRERVVNLCASAGVPVGPCIHITGWKSLPRMRVFEENASVVVMICSADGLPRGSTSAIPWTSETIAAALPLGGLPGNSTAAKFKICCADGETVAETNFHSISDLFSLATEIELPLIRMGVEVNEAFLRLRGSPNLELS